MTAYDGSEDVEESAGGIDLPELALGISLIGLGAVLVYKALNHRGKGGPLLPQHRPIDISYVGRTGPQITAKVKLDSTTTATCPVSLNYFLVTGPTVPPGPPPTAPLPAGYLASPPPTMDVHAGDQEDPFTFYLGTAPAGTQIMVQASTIYSTAPVWMTFKVE